jgi:glutamate dehydrogenase
MPGLRIVAVTDGPAAIYDPEGIDRQELSRLVHTANLDSFDPKKLHGEGSYMIFNKPRRTERGDLFRMALIQHGKLSEKEIDRDEFMYLFQNNICHKADVFIPCGGRPRTITPANVPAYAPNGVPSSRAIVEGANSFISPEARLELQRLGVVIVKDASANKCGVITSSYEILSGIMLDEKEFHADKAKLVREVMEILRRRADDEAEWLFAHFTPEGKPMTELTEELSGAINAKNRELRKFLEKNPQYVTDELILSHLPKIFSRKYRANLKRIPASYRRAIASVELASRIIYRLGDLSTEIRAVY